MTEIAISSRFAWPNIGGAETLVRTIAGALAARDHTVSVFAHRIDSGGPEWLGYLDRGPVFPVQIDPASGVPTAQLRLSPMDAMAMAPFLALMRLAPTDPIQERAARWFERVHAGISGRCFSRQFGTAEIVHRFGGNRMALATVGAARRLGSPVVITPLAHPGQWDDDPVSALAYQDADLVFATSHADAQTYEGLGVDPAQIKVCPLPSRPAAKGGGSELRSERDIEGPIVLFLGVRRPYKGVRQLLEAAPQLASKIPEATIALVGPGPRVDHDQPNVIDVGFVDEAERDRWLDAADLVCLPSSAESFGLAVSDAWSAGIPVVTSDIPVLRERVMAASGGLAVTAEPGPLADAIISLLEDDALRRSMGNAGQRHWSETSTI
jgi:glycosyltransferase involved in cell wall biosynthesis